LLQLTSISAQTFKLQARSPYFDNRVWLQKLALILRNDNAIQPCLIPAAWILNVIIPLIEIDIEMRGWFN